MKKKLYRSTSDKKLFGVCGGLAAYFEVDVTIIRVLWLIATLFWGSGLLCYVICAIAMPVKKEEPVEYEYIHKTTEDSN
ncbi:MAG: PspC domain-containing protein [Treponema sp.]